MKENPTDSSNIIQRLKKLSPNREINPITIRSVVASQKEESASKFDQITNLLIQCYNKNPEALKALINGENVDVKTAFKIETKEKVQAVQQLLLQQQGQERTH